MAVTVVEDRYLILDDDFRIVEVSPAVQAIFAPLLGERIFEAFPDSEPLFRPQYDRVRCTEPVEFGAYYDGYVFHVHARPLDSGMLVTWETLEHLDVMTLDALQASLDRVLAALAECEAHVARDVRRASLSVVDGAS